ncbi:MAG TPA: hypothetical protein VFT22_45025 [Kofleriaceae bacterium]|nr:hypothetical protein [Kofleriaceae bacterium]
MAPFLAVVVLSGMVLLWLALPPRRARRRRPRRSSQMPVPSPRRATTEDTTPLAEGSLSGAQPAGRPRLPGLTRTRPEPAIASAPPKRHSAPRRVPTDAFSDDT